MATRPKTPALHLLTVFMLALCVPAFSSDKDFLPEKDLKAMFIEATTRFIGWPDSVQGRDSRFSDTAAPFIIGIFGDDAMHASLERIFSKTRIKQKKVEVLTLQEPDQADSCHLVFIPRDRDKMLPRILAAVKGRPVLTVGDDPEFGKQGVIVNLIHSKKDARILLEINERALRASGLQASYHLFKIAKVIEPVPHGKDGP